jgi:nucleotide-binding universal stress UspA family protein
MASTIVLGYDTSGNAQLALDKAVEIARLDGSSIVIVVGYEIPAAYGGETGDYRRAVRDLAEHAAGHAMAHIRDAGVPFEVELVAQRPAEALVAVAAERGAKMIVVGTHGEHPVKGVILGSVAHKLLHISPVPVLVVPEPE